MHDVTATDLARNTSEVLGLVMTERRGLTIKRGKHEVARLLPATPNETVIQLFDDWQAPPLSKREAKRWLADSRQLKDHQLRDPWQ